MTVESGLLLPADDRWLTTAQRTDATTTHERMGLRERLPF
jgi:hypothetical protein